MASETAHFGFFSVGFPEPVEFEATTLFAIVDMNWEDPQGGRA